MKLETLKGSENYQAEIIEIKEYRKHPNADKLFIININNNDVITGIEPNIGDLMVYFPVLSKINPAFLSFINGFTNPELNQNKEIKGFFTDKCRVKPIRLRSIPSQGYMHPIKDINKFFNTEFSSNDIGTQFNSINDTIVCDKYIIFLDKVAQSKQEKSSKISRLVENQFKFHVDTENLRRNINNIDPEDIISLHYKKHGTSFVVGNILTKRLLTWWEKLLSKFINLNQEEYDLIYSSRKVVKNGYLNANPQHYYTTNVWEDAKNLLIDKIPKGYTLYGEILGYTKTGKMIQKEFDYGCNQGEMKIYIYRVTFTNPDGVKIELTDKQIEEYCEKYNLNYKDTFIYYGRAIDRFNYKVENETWDVDIWRKKFLEMLENAYTEKLCYICTNKVPEEGIVLRKEKTYEYEAYKLKSFKFLEWEDKQLDAGEGNLEDQN